MPFILPATPARAVQGSPEKYTPLSSVWEGSDADLLEEMFAFYASVPVEPILDSTYNAGRFWKGSGRRVVSMDIDPRHKPMIVGDNREMVGVQSSTFGVVVYDPPHVGPQGRDKSRKRFDADFGATMSCGADEGWTLSYLYSGVRANGAVDLELGPVALVIGHREPKALVLSRRIQGPPKRHPHSRPQCRGCVGAGCNPPRRGHQRIQRPRT